MVKKLANVRWTCVLLALLVPHAHAIEDEPAAARPAALLQRIRDSIDELGLSDAQQSQVDQIVQRARQQFREMAPELQQLSPDERRQRVREVLLDLRQQTLEVLDEDQRVKFDQKMDDLRRDPNSSRRRGQAPKSNPPATAASDAQTMTDMTAMSEMASPDKPARAELRPVIPLPATRPALLPGREAPDFTLEKVTSGVASLSAYRGKVLVILFGSYSSPSFRQRAGEFEQVNREYTRRGVECLIVYTRESHAVGEWEVERNKDVGVAVEQPGTLADRRALAKQARETLKITIPIAIDTLDDKTAKDYDGFTNACVVVGRDGVVVARQTWFNADTLRRQLDSVVAR